MKTIHLTVFILFLCLCGYAQSDLREEIKCNPKADKIFEFTGNSGYVSFRSGDKWGLYNIMEQKITVQPEFDFIYMFPHNDYFYGIKNNKIGMYYHEGTCILKPGFSRLGYLDDDVSCYFASNDSLHSCDGFILEGETRSLQKALLAYNPMSGFYARTVEIAGKSLVINNRRMDYEAHVLQRIDEYGEAYDSLDEYFNPVYGYDDPSQFSGIADIKTGNWILKPEFFIVKQQGENYLVTKHKDKNDREADYFLYTADGKLRTELGKLSEIGKDPEKIQQLIPYSPVSGLTHLFSDFLVFDYYGFYKDNKYGVFSTYNFEAISPPVNDYVYMSPEREIKVEVNNGKLSCEYTINGISFSDKNLDSIAIYRQSADDMYSYGHFVRKNNKLFREKENGILIPAEEKELLYTFVIFSAAVNRDHLVINDFEPMGPFPADPIMVDDGFGGLRDSCSGYDEWEYCLPVYPPRDPGFSRGGVYDMKQRKWIIPQKFSSVFRTATGYSCIRQETVKEFYTLYSAYDKNGKPVFEDISVSELFESDGNILAFAGIKGSIDRSFFPDDYFNELVYYYLPVKINVNGKWGIFELARSRWVLRPEYDEIARVDDFNFLVLKNNKTGITGNSGDVIIPVFYTGLESASEGSLIADEKWVYNNFRYVNNAELKCHLNTVNISKTDSSNLISNSYYLRTFIHDNKWFVNEFRDDRFENPLMIDDGFGGFMDSIDNDGNVVMMQSGERKASSRYFDMLTKKWYVLDEAIKTIPVGENYALLKTNLAWEFRNKNFALLSAEESNKIKIPSTGDFLDTADDNPPLKIAYDRYLFCTGGNCKLIDSKRKTIINNMPSIETRLLPYADENTESTLNPVYLVVKEGNNNRFIYTANGKKVAQLFDCNGCADVIFEPLYGRNGKFWLFNGKSYQLCGFDGMDFSVSAEKYDSISVISNSMSGGSEKAYYLAFAGVNSFLLDDRGKILMKFLNGEKISDSGIENFILVMDKSGKTTLTDPSGAIKTGITFDGMPLGLNLGERNESGVFVKYYAVGKGGKKTIYKISENNGFYSSAIMKSFDFDEVLASNNLGYFWGKSNKGYTLVKIGGEFNAVNESPFEKIPYKSNYFQNFTYAMHKGELVFIEFTDTVTVHKPGIKDSDSLEITYWDEYNYDQYPVYFIYRNGKKGIYDFNRRYYIEPVYNNIYRKGWGSYGYLEGIKEKSTDLFLFGSGKKVNQHPIQSYSTLANNIVSYKSTDGKNYLADRYGENHIEICCEIKEYIRPDYFVIEENGKKGFMSFAENKIMLKPEFDTLTVTNYYSDEEEKNFVSALKGGKLYLYDDKMKLLFVANGYERVECIGKISGKYYFTTHRNNLMGVIDEKGKEIIKPGYYSIGEFYGKFLVEARASERAVSQFGVIDEKGKIIIKPEYARITWPEMDGYFCTVRTNEGKVFLVTGGKKPKFKEITVAE